MSPIYEAGLRQILAVPVVADAQVAAVAFFGRELADPGWEIDEREALAAIGAAAGAALAKGLRYTHARHTALTLQHRLLTEPPAVAGLDLCARYRPAGADEVGGDWYGVLVHPGSGTVSVTVGDVAGHDIAAAAAMGQLRACLRTLAFDRDGEDPGRILDRLAAVNSTERITDFATLVHAQLTRHPDGPDWDMWWAQAGHLPPILLTGDGPLVLTRPSGAALIHGLTEPHGSARITVQPGAVLLCYTDGLIEVPGVDLKASIADLAARARRLADRSLDCLCDTLMERAPQRDDVALLAVRVRP